MHLKSLGEKILAEFFFLTLNNLFLIKILILWINNKIILEFSFFSLMIEKKGGEIDKGNELLKGDIASFLKKNKSVI